MELNKLAVALLATSTLLLSACGGGSSSSGSDTTDQGNGNNTDNTDTGNTDTGNTDTGNTDTGNSGAATPAWTTPAELEDGSVTVSGLMVGGTASKPMMAYNKGSWLYIREFDGSNWSSEHQLASFNGTQDISWAFNANGKAVLALENNATNTTITPPRTECRLEYYRYNGTQWGGFSRLARHLINPNGHYTCDDVDDLKIALSDDDSIAMIWNRGDLLTLKGRVQSCDSTDTCKTAAASEPQRLGNYNAVALGMGNDGKGYILKMETSKISTSDSGVFATSFSKGIIGFSVNIGDDPGTSGLARIAVNDANHALALFNANNTLQARFHNGFGFDNDSDFAPSVELDDGLAGTYNYTTLEAYLSAGADYGLSLWVNDGAALKTNISDAGSFSASSTEHQQSNDQIRSVQGAINDNGKAVIVWLGYDLMTNGAANDGTLYARFYDGSAWQDVQTIDSGIDVDKFLSVKGGLGVYLDNSDDVTVVYNAYKSGQATSEPKTFYARRVIE